MFKEYGRRNRRRLTAGWVRVAVVLAGMTSLALPLSASADEQAFSNLPAAKQTTLGLYVTAKEAYELWQADPGRVRIVDVRTPEEFIFVGNPEMAWKIPVAAQSDQWDAEKQQFPMQMLPDFVHRVRKVAEPDDTLLVMCRSGGRSAIAANLLAAAGYTQVYSIIDGMEGDPVKDPNSVFSGKRLVNGWKNSGLPWTYGIDPQRMVLPAANRERD